MYHQLAPFVGKIKFVFYNLSFFDKMLYGSKKIKTTSLGHQESGNASSHPNHVHQSTPVMQPPSIQQV